MTMMQIYFSRFWWYIAIGLFLFGALLLPIGNLPQLLLPALAVYLPGSITWGFISPLFFKHFGYREKTCGVPTNYIGYALLTIGLVLIITFVARPVHDLTELGFVIFFCGMDWILMSREGAGWIRRWELKEKS